MRRAVIAIDIIYSSQYVSPAEWDWEEILTKATDDDHGARDHPYFKTYKVKAYEIVAPHTYNTEVKE